MEKLLLSFVLFIVAATSLIAQDLSPYHHIIKYNTPQLLDQKVSGAKLIFRAVLCSILV